MATNSQPIQSTPAVNQDEKLGFREKLGYGLTVFANNPIQALLGSFLLIFYTDVVGLNPAAVATLFLVSRIIDGINDPITGYLLDHFPRVKMGKFRFLLIVGIIILALNYLLVWFGPVWFPGAKLVVAYISYLLLGITYDVADIAKGSLLPVMTTNQKERGSLAVVYGLSLNLGALLFSVGAPVLLAAYASSLLGYQILIFVTTGLVVGLTILGTLWVKERVQPDQKTTTYSFKETFRILAQKPVVAVLSLAILFGIAGGIGATLGVFFYTYVMKDLSLMGPVTLVMVIGLLPGVVAAGKLTARLGAKKALIIGCGVFILGIAIRWIDPRSIPVLYVGSIFYGLGAGMFQAVVPVVMANNIDYVDYKLNYRSEAVQAALGSFILKVGSGVGAALPGYMLAWFGYVANNPQQSEATIQGIILCCIVLPVVFLLIGLLVFGFGYNLDAKLMQEIETTLSARRAAKTESAQ
jgi:GPH family glycoside/pentoside/hexuronide:cation symporter/glucuronide carrier protein